MIKKSIRKKSRLIFQVKFNYLVVNDSAESSFNFYGKPDSQTSFLKELNPVESKTKIDKNTQNKLKLNFEVLKNRKIDDSDDSQS